jgi:hypothetical protein
MQMNDATFCFLLTGDLTKEHIWREWFAGLERLHFKYGIVVHCSLSHKGSIKSEWLQKWLMPDSRMRPTAWGWVIEAMMSMYEHALQTHPAEWYTLHSESCVPMVSPEIFVETFNKHKKNSFVSYDKIWWNPNVVKRANLRMFPAQMHLVHSQWCIFCNEDLSQMVNLSKTNKKIKDMLSMLSSGHAGEESYAAVLLLNINRLKNVIKKKTTLVDWKRTPNGNNPYKFDAWTKTDEEHVRENFKMHPNEHMFMRKVGAAFPDDVLRKHIFDNFK